MTYKLLIVDDEPANLRLLEKLFSTSFQCLTASSGAEAMILLEQHDVALLISDQRMPMMTGIELLKQTAAIRPHMVRILLTGYTDVDALVEAINSGLVYMYITKPWNNEDLKLRVNRACEHYEQNKNRQALVAANQRLLFRLQEVKLRIGSTLSEMSEIRDGRAFAHAMRVRSYAMTLSAKVGISEELKEELSMAALLHHLGRIDSFSKSPSKVAALRDEQSVLQAFSACEARLLRAIPELENVAETVSCYLENFDGSGLPRGLNAEQIPLLSRILRIADEYDQVILSKGSVPITHDEAMGFLTKRSGKHFDPKLLEVFSCLSAEELHQADQPLTTQALHLRQHSFNPAYLDLECLNS